MSTAWTSGATLTANITLPPSRLSQAYALLQQPPAPTQNDAIQVMGFLLAGQAASSVAAKWQAVGIISQVVEVAIQALDEIYGVRPMPLHRPDPDQMATLIQQIATVRSATGLGALPALKQ